MYICTCIYTYVCVFIIYIYIYIYNIYIYADYVIYIYILYRHSASGLRINALRCWTTSGMRQCQKRPIHTSKETYLYGKRGLLLFARLRYAEVSKETYLCIGRSLLKLKQKRV